MGQLERNIAIVTGAASGIGLGITRLFAREGGRCCFVRADVSSLLEVRHAVEQAVKQFGSPDLLINNAAIRIMGKITDISEEQWDQVIDTDLKGVFLFSQQCVPLMAAKGGGVIINISSGSAYGRPNRSAYAAAKAGVIGPTRAMSLDHRDERIRVNCEVPNFTLSGMTENSAPEMLAAQAAKSVAGRVSTPEDVARAVLFLCSDLAATITGAILEMGLTP